MGEMMTWREMKETYPDEWLLITNYERDRLGDIVSGIVARHSPNKDDVYQQPLLKIKVAFEYTGESTFRGFRSHADHHSI